MLERRRVTVALCVALLALSAAASAPVTAAGTTQTHGTDSTADASTLAASPSPVAPESASPPTLDGGGGDRGVQSSGRSRQVEAGLSVSVNVSYSIDTDRDVAVIRQHLSISVPESVEYLSLWSSGRTTNADNWVADEDGDGLDWEGSGNQATLTVTVRRELGARAYRAGDSLVLASQPQTLLFYRAEGDDIRQIVTGTGAGSDAIRARSRVSSNVSFFGQEWVAFPDTRIERGTAEFLVEAVYIGNTSTTLGNSTLELAQQLSRAGAYTPHPPRGGVTFFFLPASTVAEHPGRASGGSAYVVTNEYAVASTLHEFVHTTQPQTEYRGAAAWLFEAKTDYTALILEWQLGYESGARAACRLEGAAEQATGTLRDPATWNGTQYTLGRNVLYGLDVRLRRATNGTVTVHDVIRRLDAQESVRYADVNRTVSRLGTPAIANWLRQRVRGANAVSVSTLYPLTPRESGRAPANASTYTLPEGVDDPCNAVRQERSEDGNRDADGTEQGDATESSRGTVDSESDSPVTVGGTTVPSWVFGVVFLAAIGVLTLAISRRILFWLVGLVRRLWP